MKRFLSNESLTFLSLILVSAGPGTVYFLMILFALTGLHTNFLVAQIIATVCSALPVVGFVIAIVLIFRFKRLNSMCKGLCIAALFLGNPIFCFVNMLFCWFSTRALANLPYM